MKTKNNNFIKQNRSIIRPAIITLLILMVPFVAMYFTSEVNWNEMDFIFMGALIFAAGLMTELAAKKIGNKKHRIIVVVAIITALLWFWVELAVGLITNWGS